MDKSEQGKRNRETGARFETKVRKDLISKGYVVCKFDNNVDLEADCLVKAKAKFNPFRKVIGIGSGFPDFIAFKDNVLIAVEAKTNGYLKPIERKKMEWLKEKGIFYSLLVAKKGDSGIIYNRV